MRATPIVAYADCDHPPAEGTDSYPYSSKVCLVGVQTFLLTGRDDAFLQASQALQTLSKYDDPNRAYPFLVSPGMNGDTPAGTADHLEQLWGTTGYDIPACTPVACETRRASGPRTFPFGSPEATLGLLSSFAGAAATWVRRSDAETGVDGVGDAFAPRRMPKADLCSRRG
ncbi:hypothetical protein [Pseudarthrobacter sp. NPDC080039]|uniref:hypothetical protein n=1 Tax=unclassified Pseudarthrobacter TaxID=2647000 RepID=UPI00344ECA9B